MLQPLSRPLLPQRCAGLGPRPRTTSLRGGRRDAQSAGAPRRWRGAGQLPASKTSGLPDIRWDPLSRAGPSIIQACSEPLSPARRWGPAATCRGAGAGVRGARGCSGVALPPRSRWMSPAIWTVRGRRRTAPRMAPARAWAVGAMEAASSNATAWGASPGTAVGWRRALVRAEEPKLANLPVLHPQLHVQGWDTQSHRPLVPWRVAPRGLGVTPLMRPGTGAALGRDSLGKAFKCNCRAGILEPVPSLLPARCVLVIHRENHCGIQTCWRGPCQPLTTRVAWPWGGQRAELLRLLRAELEEMQAGSWTQLSLCHQGREGEGDARDLPTRCPGPRRVKP